MNLTELLLGLPSMLKRGGHNVAPGGGREYTNAVAPMASREGSDMADLVLGLNSGRYGPNVVPMDYSASREVARPSFSRRPSPEILHVLSENKIPIHLSMAEYSSILDSLPFDRVYNMASRLGYNVPEVDDIPFAYRKMIIQALASDFESTFR